MGFYEKKGKIKLLRTNDLHSVWGPPSDALRSEVVVVLDSATDMGFGLDLHSGDPDLPARMAMHGVLRDAYFHDKSVSLHVDVPEGKKNGYIRRVELE